MEHLERDFALAYFGGFAFAQIQKMTQHEADYLFRLLIEEKRNEKSN